MDSLHVYEYALRRVRALVRSDVEPGGRCGLLVNIRVPWQHTQIPRIARTQAQVNVLSSQQPQQLFLTRTLLGRVSRSVSPVHDTRTHLPPPVSLSLSPEKLPTLLHHHHLVLSCIIPPAAEDYIRNPGRVPRSVAPQHPTMRNPLIVIIIHPQQQASQIRRRPHS